MARWSKALPGLLSLGVCLSAAGQDALRFEKTWECLDPADTIELGTPIEFTILLQSEEPMAEDLVGILCDDAFEGLRFVDFIETPAGARCSSTPGRECPAGAAWSCIDVVVPADMSAVTLRFETEIDTAGPFATNQADYNLSSLPIPLELLSDDPRADCPTRPCPSRVPLGVPCACNLVLLRNAAYPDEGLTRIFTPGCPTEPPLDPGTTLDPYGEDCLPGTADDDTYLCLPSSDRPDPDPPDRALVLYQVDADPPVSNPVRLYKAAAAVYVVF
jgi:hypothetical protein